MNPSALAVLRIGDREQEAIRDFEKIPVAVIVLFAEEMPDSACRPPLLALSPFESQRLDTVQLGDQLIAEELFYSPFRHPENRLTGDEHVVERFERRYAPAVCRCSTLLSRSNLREMLGFACSHGVLPGDLD